MEREERDRLVELIEGAENTQQSGQAICKELVQTFNCFGCHEKTMKELYENLSRKGKKVLDECLTAAAEALAYDKLAHSHGYADRRNEASRDYAFEHLPEYRERFAELLGFIPERRDSTYFRDALSWVQMKENGRAYLLGFLSEWGSTHPTLQQSVFGGYVRGVQEKDACFPCI